MNFFLNHDPMREGMPSANSTSPKRLFVSKISMLNFLPFTLCDSSIFLYKVLDKLLYSVGIFGVIIDAKIKLPFGPGIAQIDKYQTHLA